MKAYRKGLSFLTGLVANNISHFEQPPEIPEPPRRRSVAFELPLTEEEPSEETQSLPAVKPQAGTGCLPCSRHHLGRVAGLLEEALRFARTDGLLHPEVVKRIDMAEREIENMEAVDLTPEKVAELPPEKKEMAEWALTKGRMLRHLLDELNAQSPVSQLEELTVRSSEIATEYRARTWGLSPETLKRLIEKAEEVKQGKKTKEQALSELKMEARNDRN